MLAGVLALPAVGSEERPVVTFTKGGATVSLAEADQSQIADRVRTMMTACSISSVSEPAIFKDHDLNKDWADTRAGSHLYVRFPETLKTRHGLPFSEVAISFEEPTFIGAQLTRNGDDVVGHVKCSGLHALELMCATALRKQLSAGQERACAVYDRVKE
jgi:hypothetical protein